MKTLEHGQMVYVPAWGKNYARTVGVIDPTNANGEIDVYTFNLGTCISNSPAQMARDNAKEDAAIPLEDGERVIVAGRVWEIKLMGKVYSDSISFIDMHYPVNPEPQIWSRSSLSQEEFARVASADYQCGEI